MSQVSILSAIESLNELLDSLKTAYWETSDIQHKDVIFDIVTALHDELAELAKLSVNDHALTYEPVTREIKDTTRQLALLSEDLHTWCPRTRTAKQLQDALKSAAALLA